MTEGSIDIMLIAGTRPNFIKIAPLLRQMMLDDHIQPFMLYSGQHFDKNLSTVFFEELGIPDPDFSLEINNGGSAQSRFAEMMRSSEPVIRDLDPAIVLVVGDVDTTLAVSLVARKLRVKVAHIEAGLRSKDMRMPEEVNRVMTDALSDYLFTTGEIADTNLLKEGYAPSSIFRVGNIMIDTLLQMQKLVDASEVLEKLGLGKIEYALLTIHRPSNVDNKEGLSEIMKMLRAIEKRIRIVWPMHPRTVNMLEQLELLHELRQIEGVLITEPLGYLDFSKLMKSARLVLTDSGGVQEETTMYNVPCITLRENTERPETVTHGSNVLSGNNADKTLKFVRQALDGQWKDASVPPLWDGKVSERIVKVLKTVIS